MRARLNPQSLPRLPEAVARPAYERGRVTPGIVHLGIGAFHRAHQAAVTDLAMAVSGDLSWGIVGVSLRSPDTRDALAPQHGLYTLALRDAGPDGQPREQLRVIGSLLEVLVAPENPGAVLERIAHPQIRIVSLTVTEKGYSLEPATGQLRWDDPDIRHDLAHPARPRSAIGMLARGLALRRERGLGPLTLLSCDNLHANGDTLRRLVLAYALLQDAGLAAWIDGNCTFPNSMVDRIVPRTREEDRARVSERLGVDDAWPVVGEPYLNWVIEDRFAAGRPAWDAAAGVSFVRRAAPYERLKLRMVNGPHSAFAYLGAMLGLRTNSEAAATPALRGYVDDMLRLEVAPTLRGMPQAALDEYRQRFLARVANPALPHLTQQIAMDGSQKVPQRLLAVIRDRLRRGEGFSRLAMAVAAWLHYLRGRDEQGQAYAIQDPLAGALEELLARADAAAASASPGRAAHRRALVLAGYKPVFGNLAGQPAFVDALAEHLERLRTLGVLGTLAALERDAAEQPAPAD